MAGRGAPSFRFIVPIQFVKSVTDVLCAKTTTGALCAGNRAWE
jgi:hypothetical protein